MTLTLANLKAAENDVKRKPESGGINENGWRPLCENQSERAAMRLSKCGENEIKRQKPGSANSNMVTTKQQYVICIILMAAHMRPLRVSVWHGGASPARKTVS